MKKEDVVSGLEQLRSAREAWGKGRTEFFAGYDVLVRRYIYEGCANYMGATQIAEALGVGASTIRTKMREMGLDPRAGKRALNASASDAMLENAALMGIDPKDMDLTSPLAYLPMGADMRRRLDEQRLKASQPDLSYEDAVSAIEKALLLGIDAEEIPLARGNVHEIAAWLASEGIVSGNRA